MLRCSTKEHVLYTLRQCIKYRFFFRFCIVLHHNPGDSLVSDLWPTMYSVYEPALTTTDIELVSSLIGKVG